MILFQYKYKFILVKYYLGRRLSKWEKLLATVLRTSLLILLILNLSFCDKLIEIPPPSNSITTSQVFSDSINAAAAISGIYSSIIYKSNRFGFCNGAETILCGLSSDELVNFESSNTYITEFYFNTLKSISETPNDYFWADAYRLIYHVNSCVEGLENSKNLSRRTMSQFTGEAKFFRALFYFYLVNLFGDVPYINSTDWTQTRTVDRTKKELVYQNIVKDLKEAQTLLLDDYSFSGGQRTRANRVAATALLARVYLFMREWRKAEQEANSVIASGLFSLVEDPNDVFAVNSTESILQWQLNTSYGNYNCTAEGSSIIPRTSTQPPPYYVSSQLLSAFEIGDKRSTAWLAQSSYNGVSYIYPYKYKNGRAQLMVDAEPTEYYTVLRLAELYLIRSEAKAQQGNLSEAIADLNVIRRRAGLVDLPGTLSQIQALDAVAQERRIELFAEWGHRWLDLKRTGQVDIVMSQVTPRKNNSSAAWQTHQQLYPVSPTQIAINPNLRQTPGY